MPRNSIATDTSVSSHTAGELMVDGRARVCLPRHPKPRPRINRSFIHLGEPGSNGVGVVEGLTVMMGVLMINRSFIHLGEPGSRQAVNQLVSQQWVNQSASVSYSVSYSVSESVSQSVRVRGQRTESPRAKDVLRQQTT